MGLKLQAFGQRGSEAELTQPACEVRPAPLVVLGEKTTFEEGTIDVYLPLVLRESP